MKAEPVDPVCTELPSAARGGPVSHAVSRVARLHRIAAGKASSGAPGSTPARSS